MKKIFVPILMVLCCSLFFTTLDSVAAEDEPLSDEPVQVEQVDQINNENQDDVFETQQLDSATVSIQGNIEQSGQIDQIDYDGTPKGTIFWSLDSDKILRIWGSNVGYYHVHDLFSCLPTDPITGEYTDDARKYINQDETFHKAAKLAIKAIVEEGITQIGGDYYDNYISLFGSCTQLKEVSLPSTLKNISGFKGCTSLSKVSFPKGSRVTAILNGAFADCSSLNTFTIPDSVKKMEDMIFVGTKIKKLTVPANCSNVSYSFDESNIEELTWNPATFGNITGWPALRTIYLGKGVKKITPSNLLVGSDNLSSIIFLGSYDYNSKAFASLSDVVIYRKTGSSTVMIEEATAGTKKVAIPSKVGSYKVTKIGDYAFDGNKYVRTVSIPASVKTIGNYAFYNCSKLNKLTLRSGLKSVGKFAFYGCNSLTSLKLPASVTSIGSRAFWNCYSLTSLALPPSIQTIGANAFESCTGLTAVNIGSTTVGQVMLEKVATPVYAATAKATTIKGNAFKNCKKLKTVTIGTRVNYIGANAFRGCKKLKTIKIKTKMLTAKKVGSCAFKGINKKATFKVPSQKLKAYKKILRKKGATKKMKFKKL